MSGVLQFDESATVEVRFRALSTVVLTGRAAVLACSAELEALAARAGQLGAMHGLAFLLEQRYTARKLPHLVCFRDADERLVGAVLLFEYCCGPWMTGMMATGDRFGVRTLIGEDAMRFVFARDACAVMLQRGARAVLVSFKWADPSAAAIGDHGSSGQWALRTRSVRDTLPLASTVDATLARLGKRTRTHLRYYRRRAEEAIGCAYVPDAANLLDLQDGALLQRLNAESLDPIDQTEFDLQLCTAALLPGGFIGGLRGADGRWLALVGGWRQGSTTWVQWQMNAFGHAELSLGTAMRAFLIEDEVSRGTIRLAFHGGTSHSMSHAFKEDQVVDMVAVQQGSTAQQFVRLAPWLYRRFPALATRGNLLGDVLSSAELRWVDEEELACAFGGTGTGLQDLIG